MTVAPPRYPLWSPDPVNTTRGLAPSTTRRTGIAAMRPQDVAAGSSFAPAAAASSTGDPVLDAIRQTLLGQGVDITKVDGLITSLERMQTAYTAQSGFANKQLDWQIKDAKRSRAQLMKQAELVAKTSRYGVDAQSRTAANALAQTARQFEASHGLELQKFGLDYAKTATDYLSTPDRFFQAGDFLDMAGRREQGMGPQPYGATGTPTPKNANDFAVLAGFQNPGTMAGTSGTQNMAAASGGATAGGASGDDPRVKLLSNIFKTIPPSTGAGVDNNDFAALQAAQHILSTNLRPGEYQKMRPGQQSVLGSAGKRLGLYMPDWKAQQVRQGVGQGSTRAA